MGRDGRLESGGVVECILSVVVYFDGSAKTLVSSASILEISRSTTIVKHLHSQPPKSCLVVSPGQALCARLLSRYAPFNSICQFLSPG